MKKLSMYLLATLFCCAGLSAQEYSDTEIGFERENALKELRHQDDYNKIELERALNQLREEYVQYYELKLKYQENDNNRIAVPTPITSCDNMDFSQNTNLWTFNASIQEYNTRPSQSTTNNSWGQQGNTFTGIINDPISGVPRFQVLPANTVDPMLNSAVDVGAAAGDNVLRMGNANEFPGGSMRGQEEISKSFILNNQNSVLQYGFAIVFENPTHAPQPNSFDIFISVNGVPLTGCSQINYSFNDAINGNGFVPSALNPVDLVRPWATNTIDLLANPSVQLGDLITISFRNRDCGWGGHGSYAYVSAQCFPNSQAITATSASGDICVDELITFTTDVDILVGATTQWQILDGTTVLTTISNGGDTITYTFNQVGTYTVNFTMTTPSGCTVNSSTTIEITECPVDCPDCTEVGKEIFSSLSPTEEECGEYFVKISPEILECYKIEINQGDGSGWTVITTSDLDGNQYIFSYADNGTYSLGIRLFDLESGKECFYDKQSVVVNCCLDCEEEGSTIFESIEETENCGEYAITVSNQTLECYNVQVYLDIIGWYTITSSDISNNTYVFSYENDGSNTYAIRLLDPITGKQCFYKKKGIEFECTSEICEEDPVLENILAENLKKILNAILDLDNGFTGICASGSSSTFVDITNMPEVVQFMQVYDLQNRLQNAIDIREIQTNGNYPYYTADITDVYYKWGYGNTGGPPCLTITFANQPFGQLGPSFQYKIAGGWANGAPLNPDGLNATLIEEFTNIVINVGDFKATYEYITTGGQAESIYDILWPYTHVEGAGNALRFCSFHDLDFVPTNIAVETENELSLYPNPTNNEFTIAFEDEKHLEEGYEVAIRSIAGVLVHQSKNQKRISVRHLPPGIYFISVLTDTGESYRKQLIVN